MKVLYFWGAIFALSIIFSIIKWMVQRIRLAITDSKCLSLLKEIEPQLDEVEIKSIDKHFLKLRSDADAFFKHLERNYSLPKTEPERAVDYYIKAERRYLRHRR